MSFLNPRQLREIGFKSIGQHAQISERASWYNPGQISIGDHSRIDDFCILSAGAGGIHIGSYVHIACHAVLIGKASILIGDYAGLSGRVSIYSSSDDFSGHFMTNPTVPAEYTSVRSAPVQVGRHAIIGAGSVVLPGVSIGEGAAIGALSLVLRDCEPFMSYRGNPAIAFLPRSKDLLALAEAFERSQAIGMPRAES